MANNKGCNRGFHIRQVIARCKGIEMRIKNRHYAVSEVNGLTASVAPKLFQSENVVLFG